MERNILECLIFPVWPRSLRECLSFKRAADKYAPCGGQLCVGPRDRVSGEARPSERREGFLWQAARRGFLPRCMEQTRDAAVQTERVAIRIRESNELVKKQLRPLFVLT